MAAIQARVEELAKVSAEKLGFTPTSSPHEPNTLMVCVDASPNSRDAFNAALKWKRPEDLLLIAHSPELIQAYSMLPPWTEREKINKSLIERGQELCDFYVKLAEDAKETNAKAKVLGEASISPKQALVDLARDEKVQTIFIGTRGLGFMKQMVLGSFSRYLVHHADCNVMVVRPKATECTCEEKSSEAAVEAKEPSEEVGGEAAAGPGGEQAKAEVQGTIEESGVPLL